ncbi:MAG: electron transport complex subunit RsxC [Cellvibrionaceae bacterium]
MRKIWDTPGGVHPPEHKAQSLAKPLFELGLPSEIILPVSQHIGAPAIPIVAVGEKVLRGQLVAEGKEFVSANVHASTSGTIKAIEDRPLPHASGFSGLCVVIEPDGDDKWVELTPTSDYKTIDRIALLEKIQQSGIVGMGGAGFPTSIKLSTQLKIDTLVINGTECEPYITADDMLMQISSDEIIEGVLLLDYLLNEPKNILIAIEDNKPKAITAMKEAVKAVGNSRIEVVPLPVKYPSGGEKQVIQMLTGIEIPSGKLPADIGAVCQNIATVLASYRAVRYGEPLTSRITTVTGEAYGTQRNVIARIGTPVSYVLDTHQYDEKKATRLVMGGPMMGFTLLDSAAPIVKTTNCLLAPSLEESPPPSPAQACIRCGMCAEACPASLLPQQLYWYARAEDEEKLQAHNLFDCIECGACSYACPSHIPLVQYYRAAKSQIKKHAVEKEHSDRARQRFEFHKERIEIEKAERVKAREEAAEKAKQRKLEKQQAKAKAEQDAKDQEEQNPATKDGAQEEPAKVKPPGDEEARLNRNLISTEERLKKLNTRATELEKTDPTQAEGVRARIKEAELKKKTLLEKLSAVSSLRATNTNDSGNPENEVEQPQANTSESIPELKTETKKSEQPKEKLRDGMSQEERRAYDSSITVLEDQLAKTQKKLDSTDPEDNETLTALQMSVNILTQRLTSTKTNPPSADQATKNDSIDNSEKEITPLSEVIRSKDKSGSLSDAIFASMEKVVESKRSENDNSLNNQLQQKIDSLETRLEEAKKILTDNREKALAASLTEDVSKLEHKLEVSREALKELVEQDD